MKAGVQLHNVRMARIDDAVLRYRGFEISGIKTLKLHKLIGLVYRALRNALHQVNNLFAFGGEIINGFIIGRFVCAITSDGG